MLDLMRKSPLVSLRGRAVSQPRAQLWAKLELALPGALKDRVALKIVEDAESAGLLAPGGLLVESSSGTMAEGLARVAALKGYRLIIVSDPRMDGMTMAKLRALGAVLEIVKDYHPNGGWQAARLERLRQVIAENEGAVWARQYDSPSNGAAYIEAMAGELHAALGTDLGMLVGPVGSGGSLCGTARGLKDRIPDLRVIAVDAVGSALFHQPDRKRLQSGHGNSVIPGNLDYTLIDEVHWVTDGEAFQGCRELARREAIFAGGSSGAAYIVASFIAEQAPAGRHVVVLMPDRGERYFETIFCDDFLAQQGLAGIAAAAAPERIRYGRDRADRWSCAKLPHDGSVAYHAPEVRRTADIARELGLE